VLKLKEHILWIVLCGALVVASGAPEASAERPRDLIHTYRVWKLTEILDLSDEQMPVFFSRLKEIDEKEAELLEDERGALREIGDLLNDEEVDETKLEKALARHSEIQRKRLEEVGRLRDEAASVLSVRQRAQYVVFEQRFRSELHKVIEKAKDLERQRSMEQRRDLWDDDFGSPGGRGGGRGGSGRGRR